jgi:hypothetical protein
MTTDTTPTGAVPTSSGSTGTASGQHLSGAFDIRNIIGALLTIYGVILLLMGIFADPQEEKTGGVNANLWAGLALLVVGGGFILWARLRPVVVPENIDKDEVDPPHMQKH